MQLVLPKRDFYERIEDEHGSAIDQKIADRHWIPPIGPNGETGSLTVTTSHHLDDPAAWREDFKWFLKNVRLFQRVLTSRVVGMLDELDLL